MDKEKIMEGVRLILDGIGEDINREGLLETPDRIARMYEELAAGYTDDAAKHLAKRFHVDNNDMVGKTFTFILFVRASYASVLRHRCDCLYSGRKVVVVKWHGLSEVCEAFSAAGAAQCADCGCIYAGVEPEGGYGTD